MDIPVSRLNERMALQLPPELPLGLVFVVGNVEQLNPATSGNGPGTFRLTEKGYTLRCLLSDRVMGESGFKEGDLIRAGGHLIFETVQAAYFLVARDVEVLEEFRPTTAVLSDIAADTTERSQVLGLARAELPHWVMELAPPELRDELAEIGMAGQTPPQGDDWPGMSAVEADMTYPAEEPALAGLSDEVISFLSEAMDSPEDVELTAQLIRELTQPRAAVEPDSADVFLPFESQPVDQSDTIVSEEQLPFIEILPEPVVEVEEDAVEIVDTKDKEAAPKIELLPWYVVVMVVLFIFVLIGTMAIVLRFYV